MEGDDLRVVKRDMRIKREEEMPERVFFHVHLVMEA